MGVITNADRELEAAKEHLSAAIKSISNVVVDRCEGFDSFVPDLKNKLMETLFELTKIRERIF